jgi:hypothetical protein
MIVAVGPAKTAILGLGLATGVPPMGWREDAKF